MKKCKLLFTLLFLIPILAKAETPLEIIDLQPEPSIRTPFIQIDPFHLGIGAGIRYRPEGGLKGHEHSVRFTPGYNEEFWGIVYYKYSLLTYQNIFHSSNYSGVGFKVGMLAPSFPLVDIQYIKGWQYESGPFKWGQLEINALPIAIGAFGIYTLIDDSRYIHEVLLLIGLATFISFNLAF